MKIYTNEKKRVFKMPGGHFGVGIEGEEKDGVKDRAIFSHDDVGKEVDVKTYPAVKQYTEIIETKIPWEEIPEDSVVSVCTDDGDECYGKFCDVGGNILIWQKKDCCTGIVKSNVESITVYS